MTREEAIDIIRKNIPHLGIGATEMTEALNELVPELRESKDERIRKELCSYLLRQLGRQKDNLMDAKFDEWIAWLEKQKENKDKLI